SELVMTWLQQAEMLRHSGMLQTGGLPKEAILPNLKHKFVSDAGPLMVTERLVACPLPSGGDKVTVAGVKLTFVGPLNREMAASEVPFRFVTQKLYVHVPSDRHCTEPQPTLMQAPCQILVTTPEVILWSN